MIWRLGHVRTCLEQKDTFIARDAHSFFWYWVAIPLNSVNNGHLIYHNVYYVLHCIHRIMSDQASCTQSTTWNYNFNNFRFGVLFSMNPQWLPSSGQGGSPWPRSSAGVLFVGASWVLTDRILIAAMRHMNSNAPKFECSYIGAWQLPHVNISRWHRSASIPASSPSTAKRPREPRFAYSILVPFFGLALKCWFVLLFS